MTRGSLYLSYVCRTHDVSAPLIGQVNIIAINIPILLGVVIKW